MRGPIRKDRVFFNQDLQFRYVATPVKSLPDEPEVDLRSFDSFTRLDAVLSPRHLLSGGADPVPARTRHVTMNTFRPEETTPDINQKGLSAGLVDRFSIWSNLVVETTLSLRRFEIDVNTENLAPMVYAPQTQSGGFFNDQDRDVTSFQWVAGVQPVDATVARRARLQIRHRPAALASTTARASAVRSRSGAWTDRSPSGSTSAPPNCRASKAPSSRSSRRTAGASIRG